MISKKRYISENLKSLRKKHNMSIYKLANEVNLSSSTIKDMENGTTHQNKIDTIVTLSQYFNVKVDDFVYKEL